MVLKEEYIKAGFSVVETEDGKNSLREFITKNHPQIIRDNEIKLDELKTALGLPVDEKVNGYGLNFVGRNVARAKYAQKTAKELKINEAFSKNFDTTQNMVLKGDNLDCLKILKSYYSGRIKCIYIDPPYNTDKDEFVYPDKFDKEEAEVLGLANISDSDFERLEFSFRSKKSHNGWLSFMYPRLLLARDLLAKDGVIFISIDDSEQANLKLLCDEIFGDENILANCIWDLGTGTTAGHFTRSHEYVIAYAKNKPELSNFDAIEDENIKHGALKKISKANPASEITFPIGFEFEGCDAVFEGEIGGNEKEYILSGKMEFKNGKLLNAVTLKAGWGMKNQICDWLAGKETFDSKGQKIVKFYFNKQGILWYEKERGTYNPKTVFSNIASTKNGTTEISDLFGVECFPFPKPMQLIKHLLVLITKDNDIILDFFAGSGTTAHAVMSLNADSNNNLHFILCQLDEPIKKDKPAHAFCIENDLPPVISSITIERLKRAGEKIKEQQGLLNNVDIGFKVFDTVDAPTLEIEENGQIVLPNLDNDPLSRIYNMIFSIGQDNPTLSPECVVENCMYRCGNNYYITNADELDKEENKHLLADVIKNGTVFIDGWTATINTTLQTYKESVKIVV